MQDNTEKQQLVQALQQIYTPIEDAGALLQQRWNNTALRSEVTHVLHGYIPESLEQEPHAVLFRNIATPNFECERAVSLADRLYLPFLYLEYIEDRFCTINPEKRILGRMIFSHGKNKHGEHIYSKKNIFDLATHDGNVFSGITTHSGEPIVTFHHRMFDETFPHVRRHDISSFAKWSGTNSTEAYPYYLSLFTCFGILFEDYDMDSAEERRFVKETIFPAIDAVKKRFGVPPIIVQLFDGTETPSHWNAFPISIKSQYGI